MRALNRGVFNKNLINVQVKKAKNLNKGCPRLFLTNARSIKNKMDEFEATLLKYKIDIATVTETWLNDEIERIAHIPKFKCLFKNRNHRRGGGVAIFVNDKFNEHEVNEHNLCQFECLWTNISYVNNNKTHNIFIGAVYYPPSAPGADDIIEHILNTVDEIRLTNPDSPMIILGDFNYLNIDSLTEQLGMVQIVDFPTRDVSLLDKVFMTHPELYTKPKKCTPLGRSDHSSIIIHPCHELPPSKYMRMQVRPYRETSVRSFGQWITNYNWNWMFDRNLCINEKVNGFFNVLKGAYNHNFPVKQIRKRIADRPWMTQNVRRLLDARQRMYNNCTKAEWRETRNAVQRSIRSAKKFFYDKSMRGLKNNDPATWHHSVRKLCNLKNRTMLKFPGHSNQDLANDINNHFASVCQQLPPVDVNALPAYFPSPEPPPKIFPGQVRRLINKLKSKKSSHPDDLPIKLIKEFAFEIATPLAHIFNCCLNEGVFPELWKLATAIPVPKVPNVTSFQDLRPISLTPIFAKMFESFLTDWVTSDIHQHLDIKQFGCRKGSSTSHYLVDMIQSVISDIVKGDSFVDICAVDFTKAFDRIDHTVIVRKLVDIRVRKSIIPTICSFLTDRKINTKLRSEHPKCCIRYISLEGPMYQFMI
ncbi:uncharacterized protein [Antedon mediterranea]|uniref:uncharacterized protein n=1 Tax=Antedon mediterranea TaxID=105859 RepID=UPI003AF5B17A